MGVARFPSIRECVATEVEATPLRERIDDDVYKRILDDAEEALRPFRTADGVELPIQGHLVAARKP
jgi:hypothetical protein